MARRIRVSVVYGLVLALFALTGCAVQPERKNYLDVSRKAEQAYQRGDYALASTLYQQLTKAVPTLGMAWFRLGNIYANTGQPMEAIKAYNEALVRDDSQTKVWYNMGVIYARQAAAAFIQASMHKRNAPVLADISAQRAQAILDILSGKTASKPVAVAIPPTPAAPSAGTAQDAVSATPVSGKAGTAPTQVAEPGKTGRTP